MGDRAAYLPGLWLSQNELFSIERHSTTGPWRKKTSFWCIDANLSLFTNDEKRQERYEQVIGTFLCEWNLIQRFKTRREAVQALEAAWNTTCGLPETAC